MLVSYDYDTFSKPGIKLKFTIEQATKAQRGSRWEWVVNATPSPLCPRETDPVPIL